MRFHIDTSSVAESDKGSQFDMRNTTGVGRRLGPWGVDAKVQNTIGFVTTDRTSTMARCWLRPPQVPPLDVSVDHAPQAGTKTDQK